jgi:hypothetical protein
MIRERSPLLGMANAIPSKGNQSDLFAILKDAIS